MAKRGIVPIALATGLGLVNGYVTFNPAFQQREVEKISRESAMADSRLGPDLVEIPVTRTMQEQAAERLSMHGNTGVLLQESSPSAEQNESNGPG